KKPKGDEAMINQSKNLLKSCALALALAACGLMPISTAAQEPYTRNSATAKSQAGDSSATASQDSEAGPGNPATPQATPQAGNPQSGISGLAGGVKTFSRNGPIRESWITIDLGTKYAKAVLGGFEQGAILGLGVQFTTADLFRFVEFRATALTSPLLYRRFEGEAYVPKVFDMNTHADIWFDYLRRTKDDFFGIGPRIPNTSQTNFDLEQRSYNASLYHDFTARIQAGGYFSESNSSTYPGERHRDIPIDRLFSGDQNTVPASAWAPGLLTNARIISYGGFGVYDLRDNSRGLTKGAYFYGRIGSAHGLKDKTAFSDYGWVEAELDARGYIPLGSDKTSLAVRGYANLKDPRGASQIPFYDLSFLGGRMYGRGFKNFRFRGNNLVLGSVELRQTVLAQSENRGLDVFGFGDAGQVWGDNRSVTDPTVLANRGFDSKNWKAAVGGGVQYRYSSSLAGRIEIGHSNERNLIYASITRGF
ncbi:MAG TPA: BamA/TamA family outer membrane protein, partial [Blastocatellia bacterium]|nr:BamA/TamA family outer membrane protein [Blastocatellia bacterium]